MLSLAFIRDHTDVVRHALEVRGSSAPLDAILDLDRRRREAQSQHDALVHQQRQASAELRSVSGAERDERLAALRHISDQIKQLDDVVRETQPVLDDLLMRIPNIPHNSVPVGQSEADNPVVHTWGEPPQFDFAPLPHWDLGERLGIMDFERASKVAGPRFYMLKGAGARLERALVNFMLDVHIRHHGYTEVSVPFLVRRESMAGTGQIPKFVEENDAYHCELDDLFLIPTAEVPVTNLHRDEILDAAQLPIKYVAYSPCFRREAGSAGRDTRGMIRVHQFAKVEMVKFTTPETSYAELEALRADAEDILQRLGLPYRVSLLCTSDMGFTSAKTYDPEIWMAGQNRFVEVSSCSNFEAFQARRASIRYRPEPGAKPEFVHTLNGSGVALSRTLPAILENNQRADGSVVIPPVLHPYMGGQEIIEPE